MPQASFCHIDDKEEKVTDETYLVCFECGHVYETQADLIKAWNDESEFKSRSDADDIPFCPLCLHDF